MSEKEHVSSESSADSHDVPPPDKHGQTYPQKFQTACFYTNACNAAPTQYISNSIMTNGE